MKKKRVKTKENRIKASDIKVSLAGYKSADSNVSDRVREGSKSIRLGVAVTNAKQESKKLDSNSTISRWENEEIIPSIEHLYNIAKYFEVSADYLIGNID